MKKSDYDSMKNSVYVTENYVSRPITDTKTVSTTSVRLVEKSGDKSPELSEIVDCDEIVDIIFNIENSTKVYRNTGMER